MTLQLYFYFFHCPKKVSIIIFCPKRFFSFHWQGWYKINSHSFHDWFASNTLIFFHPFLSLVFSFGVCRVFGQSLRFCHLFGENFRRWVLLLLLSRERKVNNFPGRSLQFCLFSKSGVRLIGIWVNPRIGCSRGLSSRECGRSWSYRRCSSCCFCGCEIKKVALRCQIFVIFLSVSECFRFVETCLRRFGVLRKGKKCVCDRNQNEHPLLTFR